MVYGRSDYTSDMYLYFIIYNVEGTLWYTSQKLNSQGLARSLLKRHITMEYSQDLRPWPAKSVRSCFVLPRVGLPNSLIECWLMKQCDVFILLRSDHLLLWPNFPSIETAKSLPNSDSHHPMYYQVQASTPWWSTVRFFVGSLMATWYTWGSR